MKIQELIKELQIYLSEGNTHIISNNSESYNKDLIVNIEVSEYNSDWIVVQ